MFRRIPFEALAWIGGLALMALADPGAKHWQVCPFAYVGDWLGLHFCPGCGLGRSIGWLARGEVARSMAVHPLGIPAVGVLVARSFSLLRQARTASHP